MDEYIVIITFLLWYIFSLVVSENLGKKKKIGVQWSFFISMMFTPLVGYLVTLASPKSLKVVK
ncbi:MAG: hypothetical protein K9G61_02295 [Bacteroidales bacterium]|jgi:hypothetical protein|nr:hypothetical protein [Bacteroidales bacterium]